MKKISRLLAQDGTRPKPPITLPRLTAADDAADVNAAPVMETPEREKIIAAAERARAMLDEKKATQKPTRWQPKGTTTSADDNDWFEALAIAEIERLPTRAWEGMLMLLPSAWPSTQKRLLLHMLEQAAKRGDALPAKVVKHLARVFAVSPKARGRIQHSTEAVRSAAWCRAENPNASWADLARAAGLKSKQARHVVRQWDQSTEFKRWVREFKARPRRGGGHSTAYDELMAKAAALRKVYPELTEAQAFVVVYADPANRKIVKRNQDFEFQKYTGRTTPPTKKVRLGKARRASVCQKKL